jgi:hypothetical protein
VQQPFEDLAKISSYSNVVTSVWHVQMVSKVDHKLSNGYIFLLLQKVSIAHEWFTHSSRLKICPILPGLPRSETCQGGIFMENEYFHGFPHPSKCRKKFETLKNL